MAVREAWRKQLCIPPSLSNEETDKIIAAHQEGVLRQEKLGILQGRTLLGEEIQKLLGITKEK